MDCSQQSHILSVDQHALLSAFFTVTDAFYLTGGIALADFYLAHRMSVDLDLFTRSDEAFAQCHAIKRATAAHLQVRAKAVRETPYFKHCEVFMPSGPVAVHSARELPVRLAPVRECCGMRIDAIEDITANKLCAMSGRGTMKDFVDLYFLHLVGFAIERFRERAHHKDAGLEAATLADATNQLAVDAVPAFVMRPVTREQLQAFKETSVALLLKLSFPPSAS